VITLFLSVIIFFSLCSIFCSLFLADRIVLARVKARALLWYDPLLSQVDHCASGLKLDRPDVYETATLPHGFYYFKSFLGKGHLLIGKQVRSSFSEAELHCLLCLALIRLKNEKKKFTWAFFLSLATIPRWIISSKHAVLFWDFFYFPLEVILRWQGITKKEIFLYDHLLVEHLGTKFDLASSLYKMHVQEKNSIQDPLAAMILPCFSLAEGNEKRIFAQFLGDRQCTKERYQYLTTSLQAPQ